jgi:hypothetical protein
VKIVQQSRKTAATETNVVVPDQDEGNKYFFLRIYPYGVLMPTFFFPSQLTFSMLITKMSE